MPGRDQETHSSFWGSSLMWILSLLLLVVLTLALLALTSPISKPVGHTQNAVLDTGLPAEGGLTPTPGPGYLSLDQEEIGHTDGIIIWSTVLLLILVIGTLRETFLRRNDH